MAKEINSLEFQTEVLDEKISVLVDFFAEWCAPCKMLAPILEQLSSEIEGKGKVVKVDIDKNSDLADKYGITAVPTLILFKNGEIVSKNAGIQSFEQLKSMFE